MMLILSATAPLAPLPLPPLFSRHISATPFLSLSLMFHFSCRYFFHCIFISISPLFRFSSLLSSLIAAFIFLCHYASFCHFHAAAAAAIIIFIIYYAIDYFDVFAIFAFQMPLLLMPLMLSRFHFHFH
jgi:hypothetical protein